MKIIGLQKKEGTYQGVSYSNYYFYVTSPIDKNGFGVSCSFVKVKPELVLSVLNEKKLQENQLLGMNVEFYYDPYGRVSLINLK